MADDADTTARLHRDRRAWKAADMAVGQRIDRVPVGDQASDAGLPSLALRLHREREPTPDDAVGPANIDRGRRLRLGRADLYDADRHDASVGHEQRLGHHVLRRETANGAAEPARLHPVAHQDQHARPGDIAHAGIAERARLAPGLVPALGRAVVGVTDQVDADRGADNVRLVHQVPVVRIARIQQVLERKAAKVHRLGKRVHGSRPGQGVGRKRTIPVPSCPGMAGVAMIHQLGRSAVWSNAG